MLELETKQDVPLLMQRSLYVLVVKASDRTMSIKCASIRERMQLELARDCADSRARTG